MPNTTVLESTQTPTPPLVREHVQNPNATQQMGRTKQKAQKYPPADKEALSRKWLGVETLQQPTKEERRVDPNDTSHIEKGKHH